MHHQRRTKLLAAAVALSTLLPLNLNASETEEADTKVDLSFRYRFEMVEQEGFLEDADASTLRTRATVTTDWTEGFETLVEFDDVTVIGPDDYNAGQGNTPGNGTFPVVADPQGTEVNQALIRYRTGSSNATFGRQRILLGNQRFVGGVGWRQNEQTYDGFTYNTTYDKKFTFNYAYISNVNRIFGEKVPAGDHKHNTNLFNADYVFEQGKLSGYYLAIDNEDVAGLSSDTFGLRFAGKTGDFGYTAEWATQSEAADNPVEYSADYYLVEGAFKQPNYSLGAELRCWVVMKMPVLLSPLHWQHCISFKAGPTYSLLHQLVVLRMFM